VFGERPVCPKCGGIDIIPIIYGYAPFDLCAMISRGEALQRELCPPDEDPPLWFCRTCETEFPNREDSDEI